MDISEALRILEKNDLKYENLDTTAKKILSSLTFS